MRGQVAEYLAHRQSRIVATSRKVAAMKKDEAKRLIIQEWDKWAASNLTPDNDHTSGDALVFFGHLQKRRQDLLTFRHRGDKWQAVHGWLLSVHKVTNR